MNVDDIIKRLIDAGAPEDFLARKRTSEYVWARFVLFDKLSSEGYSQAEIGRITGRKHSAVGQGLKRAKHMMEYPKIYPEFNRLRRKFDEL